MSYIERMLMGGSMGNERYVLIVDDEPFNLEILSEYLQSAGYNLLKAEDGTEALSHLNRCAESIDVVLLDRMMPNMNGMEVLAHMKQSPEWHHIPIILQTAVGSPDSIREGLQAGAYYYLTKPYEKSMLLAVVSAAGMERRNARKLAESLTRQQACLRLMSSSTFRFRRLEEAHEIASLISSAFPDPHRVAMGLSELIINGIEHGNLDIRYEEKGRLLRTGNWQAEVQRRLALPEYENRHMTVSFERTETEARVTITDEGEGFDWRPYLELSPDRAFDPHGRGISMARMISFDSIEYQGRGNVVTVAVRL